MPATDKKTCCMNWEHSDHRATTPRLNRAIGQLEGVKRMIESGRYCPDILTQLRAARTAIKSAETEIFIRHLEKCVINSFGEKADEQIAEIKKIIDFMN